MQRELVQAAGEMPVLGPNCYGLLNYLDGVPLWPDQHGGRRVSRGVALICQSSNIALNLTMQQRGLPIAMVVTLGTVRSWVPPTSSARYWATIASRNRSRAGDVR